MIRKELIYSDNTTNACMFSDIIMNNDTVRIYNVHLKSVGFSQKERDLLDNVLKKEYNNSDVGTFKAIIRQMALSSFRRARQVDFVAKHISESPYPVIIFGDFNDPPNSYSYQKILGKCKDSFMESGKGRSTTYNIGSISSQRIDYILHSKAFKAYGYQRLKVPFSDHFPVACYLVKQE
jgi:endonuclease/exonuclease/phosphatase family metal-dependent hydrolase